MSAIGLEAGSEDNNSEIIMLFRMESLNASNCSSAAVIIRPIEPSVQAVVGTFYPGPQGGAALAKILFGDENPSGKLAFTYPRYSNAILPYDHKTTEDRDIPNSGKSYHPQYEFGHGLSYTDFTYSNLRIKKKELSMYETLIVDVDISNTGSRAGKEVVQLYVKDHLASITPPVKRLRAFEKVSIAAGETRTIRLEVPISDLAFVGMQNEWIVEPGAFSLTVGNLRAEFTVK